MSEIRTQSGDAGEDLLSKKHYLGRMSGSDLYVATAGVCHGVITHPGQKGSAGTTTGSRATMQVEGPARVIAGDTISQFDKVTSDANGKAVVATMGDAVIGICLEEDGLTADEYGLFLIDQGLGNFAELTDGEIAIPLDGGIKDGTPAFTYTMAAGVPLLVRTAGAGPDSWWKQVPTPNRSSTSRGVKATSLVVTYEVETEAADDVQFELGKATLVANGDSTYTKIAGGSTDADYDEDNNTAAERGAIGTRTATITVGTPAYLAANESYVFRFYTDDTTGNNAVTKVHNAKIAYSETPI